MLFSQVYTRRKVISKPLQVQTFDSTHNKDAAQVPIDDKPTSDSTHNEDATHVPINDTLITLRKPTKECTKQPLYPYQTISLLKGYPRLHKSSIVIPKTVSEALSKREWQDAMKKEIYALEKNNTWEIVDRLKEKKYSWM